MQAFIKMVQNQFHITPKFVRFDNGLEFMLSTFYNSLGIIHQISCVETHQQNGRVERKHQHILNVGRAFLFQSKPVNHDSPPSLPITTRHSTRNINAPSYLQDYVCNNIHASTYPISNYISHNNLSNLHSHFIMSIHSNHEHKTYIEASKFDC